MKKIAAIILSAVMLSTCIVCMTGCYDPTDEFVSDGDFVYYYMGNWHKWMGNTGEDSEDCYTIVGINEEGLKEKIYVPAYYNGKEVRYTYLEQRSPMGISGQFGLEAKGNVVYFPFSHCVKSTLYFVRDLCGDCYFTNCDDKYVSYACSFLYGYKRRGFCNPLFYDKYKQSLTENVTIEEISNYILRYRNKNDLKYSELQKANTSYMFNYGGAPNEGYFFINDFERGGKIEKLRTTRKEKGMYLPGGIENRNALTYGILNRIRCQRRNMMKTESLYIQKQNCMQSGKPLRIFDGFAMRFTNFSLYGII